MKSIKDLTEVTSVGLTDEFLVSLAAGGDRKVKFSALQVNTSPNAVFRGKNLGTITASNIDAFIADHGISTGAFVDIYVGDYFTISYAGSNKIIRVAGFNVFKQCGDNALTRNHIICVPDSALTTASMNSTHTTGVSQNEENTSEKMGFLGSDMWNITLPKINENLEAIFGGHLLTHRELLSNSVDMNASSGGCSWWKGASNGWEWVDCKAVLMSEAELYGCNVWSSSPYDTGIAKQQLPLFSLEPRFIHPLREWFWLRNVASSSNFCFCYGSGGPTYNGAGNVGYVRPRFLLG